MSDKLLIDRKLLERLQERLDPHIDARDWGMVCDAFRTQAQAAPEAEPVAWQTICSSERRFSANKCSAEERAEHWRADGRSDVEVEPLFASPQHDAELVELLREARRAMTAVLAQEKIKAVAKRVLAGEIARIDAKLATLRHV